MSVPLVLNTRHKKHVAIFPRKHVSFNIPYRFPMENMQTNHVVMWVRLYVCFSVNMFLSVSESLSVYPFVMSFRNLQFEAVDCGSVYQIFIFRLCTLNNKLKTVWQSLIVETLAKESTVIYGLVCFSFFSNKL